MHYGYQKALIISLLILLTGNCAHTPSDPEVANNLFVFSYSDSSDGLLSNDELRTESDLYAAPVPGVWEQWIQTNNIPIRSLTSENYSDLEFLKTILDGRRIVQLGESGHGVKEFNLIKVRLIKFLHRELGFDVIAFESPLYECFYSNANSGILSSFEMIKAVYNYWHSTEVLHLFDYIRETRNSTRPLMLAGFDIHTTGGLMAGQPFYLKRPVFFRDIIAKTDSSYAEEIYNLDNAFVEHKYAYTSEDYIKSHGDSLKTAYNALVSYFDQMKDVLVPLFPENPIVPLIARQEAWSIVQYIDQIQHYSSYIRDPAMASNIEFIADELYPDKKIIIWAHNFHIRHKNTEVNGRDMSETMGTRIAQKYRAELYSIGLYMYRGKAAKAGRDIYTISYASPNSLEALFYTARRKYLFVDLMNQILNEGNEWMFVSISSKTWGAITEQMVLRDQYDAILFIDTVNPPEYLDVTGIRSRNY